MKKLKIKIPMITLGDYCSNNFFNENCNMITVGNYSSNNRFENVSNLSVPSYSRRNKFLNSTFLFFPDSCDDNDFSGSVIDEICFQHRLNMNTFKGYFYYMPSEFSVLLTFYFPKDVISDVINYNVAVMYINQNNELVIQGQDDNP